MALTPGTPDWLKEEIGLTEDAVRRRRELFGLTSKDAAILSKARTMLASRASQNAEVFFTHLSEFSQSQELFRDKVLLDRARKLKEKHLVASVQGTYDWTYVKERLELALLYDNAHVDVGPMIGAFHHIIDILGEQIMASHKGPAGEAEAIFTSLRKVLSFDLGLMTEVLIFLRENTIRRLGEQASQYARSLIEASLDPLVTISPEGKITDVNEATIAATGISREKLIGTDFSNYFTEPAKARQGYQQVFSLGLVRDYPLTMRQSSGKLIDVLYNATVYKDAAGKVLGVFAAARDVTAQKQASQYARSLIEASLDPLVTISPEGKITDVNDGSVKVTGVPREQLIGTDFSNYFTEPEKAREGYQQVFSKGFVTDYPLTIRHTTGKLTHVLYNATVYKDAAGKVLGVFAAARDVTAQKQAEAEVAEQRQRELNRLAELERFNRLTVGRELKMIELKKQIEDLQKRVAPTP
jgi:PAS domain S-box-containing protein